MWGKHATHVLSYLSGPGSCLIQNKGQAYCFKRFLKAATEAETALSPVPEVACLGSALHKKEEKHASVSEYRTSGIQQPLIFFPFESFDACL